MVVFEARVASPPRVNVEFELVRGFYVRFPRTHARTVRALAHELRRAGEGPSFGGRDEGLVKQSVLLYTVGGRSETNFLGFNSVLSDSFGTFCPFGRGLKPGPENDPTQNWAQNQRGTPSIPPRTELAKIVGSRCGLRKELGALAGELLFQSRSNSK